MVVRKATRVPASGSTGTGSRAVTVATISVATLTSRKNWIPKMDTTIASDAT